MSNSQFYCESLIVQQAKKAIDQISHFGRSRVYTLKNRYKGETVYPITTLTGSVLALVFIYISLQVIKLRRQYQVSIGAGGHEPLERIIRAHGNFAEYVPIALLLMLCAEANHAQPIGLIFLAFFLILGRLFHAYALIVNKQPFKYRFRGMVLTFAVIILLAVLNGILLLLSLISPSN